MVLLVIILVAMETLGLQSWGCLVMPNLVWSQPLRCIFFSFWYYHFKSSSFAFACSFLQWFVQIIFAFLVDRKCASCFLWFSYNLDCGLLAGNVYPWKASQNNLWILCVHVTIFSSLVQRICGLYFLFVFWF